MSEQLENLSQDFDNSLEEDENKSKYLVFSLEDELYASPLLSIKEVVKVPDIKPVPYMSHFFKGVMNLRGQIVSVIDLRLKFGFEVREEKPGYILVFEVEKGFIGVIVDNVESVLKFEEGNIDRNPQLETKVPTDFFIGVAKQKDSLINLVEISKCLSSEDMRTIKKQSVA